MPGRTRQWTIIGLVGGAIGCAGEEVPWTGPVDEELGDIEETADPALAAQIEGNFRGGEIAATTMFYNGRESRAWFLGSSAVGDAIAPIHVFQYQDTGEPVAGQHAVIDTVPGSDDWTPMWEPVPVRVPRSYQADAIKSKASIDAAVAQGLAQIGEPLGVAVGCAVTREETALEGQEIACREEEQGEAEEPCDGEVVLGEWWYRGYAVHGVTFHSGGQGGAFPVTEGADGTRRVLAADMFSFRRDPNGTPGDDDDYMVHEKFADRDFDGDGRKDQSNAVLAAYIGDEGYSPLWRAKTITVRTPEAGGPELIDTTGDRTSEFMALDDVTGAGMDRQAADSGRYAFCPSRPGE